ncbi:aldo/keto reductase, partial [Candidatus Woesebacteria bacterium]|nr:aldo/keto reductase [Candidatus Woesebacteria bacterium]
MDQDSTHTLLTGNEIPVMGLGTWQLTDDTADTVVEAIEMGYRLIDTSSDYGTQPGIGRALQQTTIERETLYIQTKVEETDDAYSATQTYLKELNIEYANMMLIHRPPDDGPGVELWQGLIRAQKEGLAVDIGVSNYRIDQIQTLKEETGVWPVVNQIEWSPFGHSHEMLDFCESNGIFIQAYSPLTREKRFENEVLQQLAQKHGKSPAQVLIRWNLELGTIPIPKANDTEHLEENLDVFDFTLGEEDVKKLHALN